MPRLTLETGSGRESQRVIHYLQLKFPDVEVHEEVYEEENETTQLMKDLYQELRFKRIQDQRRETASKNLTMELIKVASKHMSSFESGLDDNGNIKSDYEIYEGKTYYQGRPI